MLHLHRGAAEDEGGRVRAFGFHVYQSRSDHFWNVNLPHQCDDWRIVGENYDGAPHEQAVTELKAFIAEAQTALAALEAREELDPEEGA